MNTKRWTLVFAACVVSALSGGCLKDKILDLVVTGETSADFVQNEVSSSWAHPGAIDVGHEIRDILHQNGYDDSDLKSAHLTSVHYGVVDFSQAHDWAITGAITVSYNGNTQTLLNYAAQSVAGAEGKKIPAPLVAGGVSLVNAALQDFIDGQNPVLVFSINNTSTTPAPSVIDPMIFTWRSWLAIQVIINQKVTVPDPF
jgi:hypothetical protein